MADRVYLLQARDQLRDELAATERLVEILRDGLTAIEALLERGAPAIAENAPTPASPPSGEARAPSPDSSDSGDLPVPDPHQPRGSEAVERLLTEVPGRWINVRDLTARQIEHGWRPTGRDPLGAVRAAANRLVRDKPDQFERAHGSYRYTEEPQASNDQESQGPALTDTTDATFSSNGSTSPTTAEDTSAMTTH